MPPTAAPTTSRALRVLTLLVTSLGSFMVLLDGSIIFVALPEIQKDFGSEMSSLQWTVDAYTLPFAALMLTAGTLGDRIGRKKVFLAGLILFTFGSALCGFADGLNVLIAGRVIQGLGAGAINTGSLSLLVSTFTEPPARAKAIGIWTAVSGVSLALGPLVGGVLINAFTWNAIFLVNLPIAVVAMALGFPKLRESRNPDARGLDMPGQVLAAGALSALVLGLIRAEADGWSSPLIIGLLLGAVVLFALFLIVEKRSDDPLLPLQFFRNMTFSASCLVAFIMGFVIVGAMFFTSQYFQSVQGHSALGAGLRLLPLTLGIFFLSPPASKIAGKKGPRIPVIVGSLVAAIGLLLMATIEADSGYSAVWWKLLLVGAGIGMMFAPLTVAVMATVPPQLAGLGSSMINTTRITGFTAGAAVLGTIVVQQFTNHLTENLQSRGVPSGTSSTVAEAISSNGPLAGQRASAAHFPIPATEIEQVVSTSFVDGIHVAYITCAGGALLAAVVAAAVMARGQLKPPAPAARQVPQRSTRLSSKAGSDVVEGSWLQEHLKDENLAILDCTVQVHPKSEGGVTLNSGLEGYLEEHIPGARFADLLNVLSDPSAERPFTPRPPHAVIEALENLGISDDTTVIVYDRAHTAFATRAWWVLRSHGVENVKVLNGGLRKWAAEGRPVTKEPAPTPAFGVIHPSTRHDMYANTDQVAQAAETGTVNLVNALSPEQHSGRVPVAHGRHGHIPASSNLPAVALLDPADGGFLPAEVLTDRLHEANIDPAKPTIAYCAAGPNATSVAFVLRQLGLTDVSVYDGGLAEWSADPARPLTLSD